MSGIYQRQVNSGSVAAPSAGRTLISVNETGELFTKDSSGNVIVYPTSSAGGGGGGATDSLSKSFTSTGNITTGDIVSVISDGTVQKSQIVSSDFDITTVSTNLISAGAIEIVKIADNKHIVAYYDTQSLTLHTRAITKSGSSAVVGDELSIGNLYTGGEPSSYQLLKFFELTSHESNKAVLSYYDSTLNFEDLEFPVSASFMVIDESDNVLTTGSRVTLSGTYVIQEMQAVNPTQVISFGYDTSQTKHASNIIEVSGSDIISSNWGTLSYADSLGSNQLNSWDSTKYDTNKASWVLNIYNNDAEAEWYDSYALLAAASGSIVTLSPDSISLLGTEEYPSYVSITNLSTDSLAFIQMTTEGNSTNLIPISISSSVSASVPIDSIITGSNVSVDIEAGKPMLQGLNNVDGSGTNVVVLITEENELISWVQSGNSFVSQSSTGNWAKDTTANPDAIDISANNSGSVIAVGAFQSGDGYDDDGYYGNILEWNGNAIASSGTNNSTGVIGIAQSTVGDGESVNVIINGIDANQTGLTPGTKYYIDSNGDVTETQGGAIAAIGTAVSETEIKLDIVLT